VRWTGVAIGLTVAAFVIAAAWMAWVISQGTNQFIVQGWPSFRYAAALSVALVIAVAALVTVNVRPPANRTFRLAVGVAAGLEILVFGAVWFSLVVVPFPA
jgi:TRAP-type C4-dicarboxylate transport system permease small subunit